MDGITVDFDPTEDQEMFKAVIERFAADRYDPERRRAYLAESSGFSRQNWSMLGEMGLTAAAVPEDCGGLGLDNPTLATIFEAIGRGQMVEPLVENVVLAGRLFVEQTGHALRERWLERLITGEARLALAHREVNARTNPHWVETMAVANDSGVRLNGTKSAVPAGHGVDGFIVSARTGGKVDDPEGVTLYFVESTSTGLSSSSWRMVDGSQAVTLRLENVAVYPEAYLTGGLAAIERAQTLASFARSAEALGVMERLLADTLEYLRTRRQFGAALGSFQAIQHRMVAQYAAVEQARALLALASMADPGDGPQFARRVAGVRAFIGKAAIEFGHEMIQFHGGMGVTDELAIAQGHKRLLMLSRWPDDATAALDRYAAAG